MKRVRPQKAKPASIRHSVHGKAMPWCERCQCYHMPTTDHIGVRPTTRDLMEDLLLQARPILADGTPAMIALEVILQAVGTRNVLHALERIKDRDALESQQAISAVRLKLQGER